MAEPTHKYWFRAKRYGWGWGLPVTWQGWVFLILWVIAIVATAPFVRPHHHPVAYAVFVAVMVGIMLAVCYAKGEPPRWRWGDRDDRPR